MRLFVPAAEQVYPINSALTLRAPCCPCVNPGMRCTANAPPYALQLIVQPDHYVQNLLYRRSGGHLAQEPRRVVPLQSHPLCQLFPRKSVLARGSRGDAGECAP